MLILFHRGLLFLGHPAYSVRGCRLSARESDRLVVFAVLVGDRLQLARLRSTAAAVRGGLLRHGKSGQHATPRLYQRVFATRSCQSVLVMKSLSRNPVITLGLRCQSETHQVSRSQSCLTASCRFQSNLGRSSLLEVLAIHTHIRLIICWHVHLIQSRVKR